jgi:hypothetical protein
MSVSCKCCCVVRLKVSATGRSLVQRSPTECGVSECDIEIPTVRRSGLMRDQEMLKEEFCSAACTPPSYEQGADVKHDASYLCLNSNSGLTEYFHLQFGGKLTACPSVLLTCQ